MNIQQSSFYAEAKSKSQYGISDSRNASVGSNEYTAVIFATVSSEKE